ncbi:MAG: TIGR03067 domain-containing protein [Planctomycetes bacterium]|nr:TIGR03067 domain-containing protein [Planctomycetota bacterium]
MKDAGRIVAMIRLMGSAAAILMLAYHSPGQPSGISEAIQGEWKLVESWANGTALPPQILGEATLKVTGDRYVLKRSKDETKGRMKIDPTQKPAHVDIITERPGEEPSTGPGILKIEDGKLHLCGAPPGHERPIDFDTIRRPRLTVLIFTRLAKP